MKPNLTVALASYAALAGLAVWQLRGKLLWAVLILMAGLALKTWIAARAGWQ